MHSPHLLRIAACLTLMTSLACSGSDPEAREPEVLIIEDMSIIADDSTAPSPDMPVDMPTLTDMSKDMTQRVPDMSIVMGPVTRRPFEASEVEFIDVHMHCKSVMQGECVIDPEWRLVESDLRGAGALLSVEHWAVTIDGPILELPYDPLLFNEAYTTTVQNEARLVAFASLDCWHDTPFGQTWAQACKADAKRLVEQGASGFKDHIGKQWDSNGDLGSFVGGWNRANGFCDVTGSDSPNVDCARQPTVRYPIREDAWREVMRYITEELRVPVVTHAATYPEPGAESDKRCYDPRAQQAEGCGKVSRDNQLEFAQWARDNLSEDAFKRIIFAHLGFATEDDLIALLDTGATLDTAVTRTVLRAGCNGRAAFGRYPDQFVMGTDRRVGDERCLKSTYDAWMHAFKGSVSDTITFSTCTGPIEVSGMELGTAQTPGCAYDVPEGTLDKVLKLNFLALYPE